MVRSTYLCQGSHRGDTASPGGKLWCVVVFEKPSKGLQETSQQAKDSSQHYWSHPSLAVTAMAHRELNTKPRERLYLIWLLLTSLLSSPVVSHRDLRPSHLSSPPLACPPPPPPSLHHCFLSSFESLHKSHHLREAFLEQPI